MAVDIPQQTADLLHQQGALQQIDVDDAAKLIEIVALVIRWRQEPPFDPILDGVWLQAGDAGHLAQHDAAAKEHRGKLLFDEGGVRPVDG